MRRDALGKELNIGDKVLYKGVESELLNFLPQGYLALTIATALETEVRLIKIRHGSTGGAKTGRKEGYN